MTLQVCQPHEFTGPHVEINILSDEECTFRFCVRCGLRETLIPFPPLPALRRVRAHFYLASKEIGDRISHPSRNGRQMCYTIIPSLTPFPCDCGEIMFYRNKRRWKRIKATGSVLSCLSLGGGLAR